MAENESLDVDGSHRWRNVFRSVMRGEPRDVVCHLMAESLCRTLRRVRKEIPLSRLLELSETQPEAVKPLIRQCKGHDYAVLFGEVLEPGASRGSIARNFLEAILEKFSDQIVYRAVPSKFWPQMHDLVDFMHDVGSGLRPQVDRIAGKWAEDPDWKPVMHRSSQTRVSLGDRTHGMLNDSLLRLGAQ